MNFEIVQPEGLPDPSGFSYAIGVSPGKVLYLAGQTAQASNGAIVGPGNIVRQFEQVMENFTRVLKAGGATPANVAKMTIFVTSVPQYRENLKALGAIYRRYFDRHYPAMTLVEVRGLFDRDAMIEVEGIAVLS